MSRIRSSWLTMTTLRPCSLAIRRSSRMISWPIFESRLAVGSSARMSGGSLIERPGDGDPLLLAAGELLGQEVAAARRDRARSSERRRRARAPPRRVAPASSATSSTFSRTVSAEQQVEVLEDEAELAEPDVGQATLGEGGDARSRRDGSSRSVGRSSAPIIESSVVLPEPDGPMMRTTSPGSTSRLTAANGGHGRVAVAEALADVTDIEGERRSHRGSSPEDDGRVEARDLADRQDGGAAGDDGRDGADLDAARRR